MKELANKVQGIHRSAGGAHQHNDGMEASIKKVV